MEGFRFLVPSHRSEGMTESFQEYRSYLDSVKDRLPPGLFDVFSSYWYYNAANHRCPHDSWLISVSVAETDDRRRDMVVEVLAAYHEFRIRYSYAGVSSYAISSEFGPRHEWDRDELQITDDGIKHVIRWATDEYWKIECARMSVDFIPVEPGPEGSPSVLLP